MFIENVRFVAVRRDEFRGTLGIKAWRFRIVKSQSPLYPPDYLPSIFYHTDISPDIVTAARYDPLFTNLHAMELAERVLY